MEFKCDKGSLDLMFKNDESSGWVKIATFESVRTKEFFMAVFETLVDEAS